MNRLSELISEERISFLESSTKREVLSEMVDLISTSDKIQDKKAFLNAIHEREEIMSTGIGLGIAVPHAKIVSVTDLVMAIGISRKGIDYEALDDQPVYIVIMIGASENQQNEYIRTLARVTLLLKNPRIRESMRETKDTSSVFNIITNY